jgi:cysteine desulfuration protein SufE
LRLPFDLARIHECERTVSVLWRDDETMKLDELLAEFEGLDPEEALEVLMDYSSSVAPVSAERVAAVSKGDCRVQECQTPVDLWVDFGCQGLRLEAVVPEKSPTVRGYVGLLIEGLTGCSAAEIEGLPDDLLPRLGLAETLGMTRRRGFHAILARIKQETSRQAQGDNPRNAASSPKSAVF